MSETVRRLTAVLRDRYRIERELGAGGMATVYLAHDVKHNRKVALKVLRAELAAVIGAERFLNEIETTANLQHPHILPLFDSGRADRTAFYVMPFVEGESLRDVLNRDTQLPVDEAVRIATQVASALEYAHRRGVVHRDIKPENILLHDDSALVADFGIALAVNRADPDSRMTETGMSLGTPQYMSPEQATGERTIDARADVYALACVLYEMLVGQPPHTGPNPMAIVASVLTSQPVQVDEFRSTVPPNVAAATMMALNKLPADRFRSAGAFAEALANPDYRVEAVRHPRATPGAAGRGPWRFRGTWVGAIAIVLLTVAAGWGWLRSPRPAAAPHLRTRYELELMSLAAANASGQGGAILAIAPDGRRVASIAEDSGGRSLYLRSLDQAGGSVVARSDGLAVPFFSPDGAWLGFHTGEELQRFAVEAGTIIPVATVPGVVAGASWGGDDRIVFAPNFRSGLSQVPVGGGDITPLTRLDTARGERSHRLPYHIPGGKGLVFTVLTSTFEAWVLDLETRDRRFVVEGSGARYVPSGHLVYTPWQGDEERVGALWAVPFDADRLEATGSPFPVQRGVGLPQWGAGVFDVSQTGTLIYQPVREVGGGRLMTVNTETGTETAVGEDRDFTFPAFAPDGRRLAVAVLDGARWNIWSYDVDGTGAPTQLTTDGGSAPLWSRDGRELIYSTGRWMTGVKDQPSGLVRRSERTGIVRLLEHTGYVRAFSWTRDGTGLLFYAEHPETGGDIYWLKSSGETEPLAADTALWELSGELSPDGRWLAYAANESGRNEVYLTPFPTRELRLVVSRHGGRSPKWASDGRTLFFVSGSELLAAPITLGANPTVGVPRTMYRFRTPPQEVFDPYDVHPDGTRIAIAEAPVVAEETPVLVVNWFEELRRAAQR